MCIRDRHRAKDNRPARPDRDGFMDQYVQRPHGAALPDNGRYLMAGQTCGHILRFHVVRRLYDIALGPVRKGNT